MPRNNIVHLLITYTNALDKKVDSTPLGLHLITFGGHFFQCDVETNFLEGQIGLPSQPNVRGFAPQPQPQMQPQPGSQLEMVLAEARRLEEIAHGNEDELRLLAMEQRGPTPANLTENFESEDPNIRAEILQLKQRLAGTDTELQKTNQTLR